MSSFLYKNVVIESVAVNLPPIEVSSAEIEDRLAPLYQKLGVPFGTLEKLSGVKTRYFWDRSVLPSEAATGAAKKALEGIDFDKNEIGALISCSVARDYFEPATASLVHRNIGLSEKSISFDISNACIGFTDGLITVANMIETGAIKAGMVVTGESIAKVIDCCIEHLLKSDSLDRENLLKLIPTLTLGGGSAAFVLCHKSMATKSHRLVGAVSRSASELADLCIGNSDYALTQAGDFNPLMHTESAKLIGAAAKLGGRTWKDATEAFGWTKEQIDHVFCHQVGKQVNEAFYKEMGLDFEKEYTIYRKYGNPISAALPTALVLGIEDKGIKSGEKIILTAFGSGLNCRFVAIEW